MSITTECVHCNKSFQARPTDLKRGRSKYCTRSCKSKAAGIKSRKFKNFICAFCKKDFIKKSTYGKSSKSGLVFCCRDHKNQAARLGGIKEIHPEFYGKIQFDYRKIAFRNLIPICNRCSYNDFIEILVVHHKDRNRSNNDLSNLEILCPNCHAKEHYCN